MKQSWRKKALTLHQFAKAKKGTKIQIQNVLNEFRMTTIERNELINIIS